MCRCERQDLAKHDIERHQEGRFGVNLSQCFDHWPRSVHEQIDHVVHLRAEWELGTEERVHAPTLGCRVEHAGVVKVGDEQSVGEQEGLAIRWPRREQPTVRRGRQVHE